MAFLPMIARLADRFCRKVALNRTIKLTGRANQQLIEFYSLPKRTEKAVSL